MIPEHAYFKELPLSFILSFKYNILLKNSGTNRVAIYWISLDSDTLNIRKTLKIPKLKNKTKSNNFVTKVLELMSALFSMLVGEQCFYQGKVRCLSFFKKNNT